MATLREIRRRITGVGNTQKITKAMKMVAAVKLRRAQDAVVSARPYARKLRDLLRGLAAVADVTANPLFAERPLENVAVVVVSADRGLCGAFNTNIIKAGVQHMRTNFAGQFEAGRVKVVCVGKKSSDFLTKNGYAIDGKHVGIFSGLGFDGARRIATELTDGFLAGRYDRVDVVYNEFKSIVQQKITVEQLLPIPATDLTPSGGAPQPDAPRETPNYIYEPSGEHLLRGLAPKHLNFQIWRILLESTAAEQGARMTAMDNATTNASDLIRDLQLSYNKARQASITKELLEIVSGAEALRNAG
ncbi:MAG TPA: ATP synthase F1 subunit gamma [Bacteroidota bacterium]|nr:ATP synthase F1 subunit gamma [Bacteroidota bacterium]